MELSIAMNRICSNKEGFLQALYIRAVLYEKIKFLKNIHTHGEFKAGNERNHEELDLHAYLCLL